MVSDDLLTPLRRRIQGQLAEQKMKKSLNLTAGESLEWTTSSFSVTLLPLQ
jgi:hypothetical protein